MRRGHFDAIRPVCPVCRSSDAAASASPLVIASVEQEADDQVLEGILHCSNASCLHEFPIIDGVPIIVPALRSYVTSQVHGILQRNDLSDALESLLGDCCGPSSAYDQARQVLSTYGWSHYADLDPAEVPQADRSGRVGSLPLVVKSACSLLQGLPSGPWIDVGCSVGRGTFMLANQTDDLVLGVDLNFSMLRIAAEALRSGRVCYPKRRGGLVYDRREFPVSFPGAERADFWACDALSLPVPRETFVAATCLNLIDCVAMPRELLVSLARILRMGARAVLTSPYDWSPGAAPPETWLGGHSQRASTGGSSEAVLRSLLTAGRHPAAVEELALTAEIDDLPWEVRLYDRSTVSYHLHMVGVTRRA